MGTLTTTVELTITECWCGIQHAVPTTLYKHMERQHANGERQGGIYCPLGHSWTFSGKGAAQIERERRERMEATLTHTRDQLEAERRSHAATKGKLTKTAKRVAGGVCPCCNRSFVQLGRHMAIKHPDYAS